MIVSKTQCMTVMIQVLGPVLLTVLGWDFVIVVRYKILHWSWGAD
jgi:hypothetical protein